MGWYHIMSVPPGGGCRHFYYCGQYTKELLAGRINRKGLLSFSRCDGLCELLPDAVAVLKERNESWGGCTEVPRSRCDILKDNCHVLRPRNERTQGSAYNAHRTVVKVISSG